LKLVVWQIERKASSKSSLDYNEKKIKGILREKKLSNFDFSPQAIFVIKYDCQQISFLESKRRFTKGRKKIPIIDKKVSTFPFQQISRIEGSQSIFEAS